MASRTKQKEEARARRLAEEQARLERDRRAAPAAGSCRRGHRGGRGGRGRDRDLQRRRQQVRRLHTGTKANSDGLRGRDAAHRHPAAREHARQPQRAGDRDRVRGPRVPDLQGLRARRREPADPNEVRSGKVKLVYRSLETATGNGPNPGVFPTQQAAALAAGLQSKGGTTSSSSTTSRAPRTRTT